MRPDITVTDSHIDISVSVVCGQCEAEFLSDDDTITLHTHDTTLDDIEESHTYDVAGLISTTGEGYHIGNFEEAREQEVVPNLIDSDSSDYPYFFCDDCVSDAVRENREEEEEAEAEEVGRVGADTDSY